MQEVLVSSVSRWAILNLVMAVVCFVCESEESTYTDPVLLPPAVTGFLLQDPCFFSFHVTGRTKEFCDFITLLVVYGVHVLT